MPKNYSTKPLVSPYRSKILGEHCVDNKLTIGQATRGEKH